MLELAQKLGREPCQDALIERLFARESWSYVLPTEPPLLVLDTRTQRWWSERSPGRPSGLMDWEALTELQLRLLDREAVVLVSAAPIFGVKLIETIQRVFSFFGQALAVDAENWMAHPGAANVILNIFRHPRTPRHFVILSGDVHYSFVYDVLIRFRKHSPRIWQITCSGLKNEFPRRLLDVFDGLNRWLYAPWSPLNWFTRRRAMRVEARRPSGQKRGHRLVNSSAIGLVALDAEGCRCGSGYWRPMVAASNSSRRPSPGRAAEPARARIRNLRKLFTKGARP
ncbi:hypothetical protein [Marinobacterium aestuariivivens]|uniref:PhoD-like phosphatase metallophosphatase domain-containing protein n=1 Tax=Marinobacterium aestuariivivens TaxID=1698799 RepID=A0ABW2A4K5_9GAMM